MAMVTDDPIGRMFKRGQLRRKTAQDGKTAEARLRAARMWQSIYADLWFPDVGIPVHAQAGRSGGYETASDRPRTFDHVGAHRHLAQTF